MKKIQAGKPVKQLQMSYDELYRQYNKLEERFAKGVKDNKDAKTKCEVMERELAKKQRTIESLIEERTLLTGRLSENKEKNRKLESKIAIGEKTGEAVKKQVIFSLKAEKKGLEEELFEAYAKLEELEDHIRVISRALEVKSEDLKVEPIFLLRIGETQEKAEKLKEKEKLWKVKIDEIQEKCEEFQTANETLKKQNDYLLSTKHEFEGKIEKLERVNEDLKHKFESVSEEHKSLLEYIDEISSQKSSVSFVHKQTKQSLEAKQLQLEELQLRYSQLESHLAKEQKSVKFERIDENTDEEFEEKAEKQEEEILRLKMRVHELESMGKDTESGEKYEKAKLDLEEMKDEREQLKQAMNEAINQCAISLVRQQALEKENQKLQKQVENLANSKLLLQNTMAEQINSLRSQVQRLKEERNEQSIRLSQ